jgi:hypothetical protein
MMSSTPDSLDYRGKLTMHYGLIWIHDGNGEQMRLDDVISDKLFRERKSLGSVEITIRNLDE